MIIIKYLKLSLKPSDNTKQIEVGHFVTTQHYWCIRRKN